MCYFKQKYVCMKRSIRKLELCRNILTRAQIDGLAYIRYVMLYPIVMLNKNTFRLLHTDGWNMKILEWSNLHSQNVNVDEKLHICRFGRT